MLANILGGFIVIVVATSLMPVVADMVVYTQQVNSTYGTGNSPIMTGAPSTLVGLTTLFFAMSIMAVGISITVGALRQAQIM